MPVTDEMTAVSWQDGHGPALKSIVKENQQIVDAEIKLVAYKHVGSSTATTQACDIGLQFSLSWTIK